MTCRVRLGLLILIVPSLCRAQTPDERRATVRWLQLLQTEDGGFRSSPDASPQGSLRATSAAVRALKKFGGEPRHREAAARFVESCWNARTGTFGDRPGATGDVILTAVGLMAVRELGLPMDRYRKAALSYLAANAREYEEVRMAAAGMEAAGEVHPEAAHRWIEQLRRMAQPDGTFGTGAQKARATGGSVVALLRLGFDRIDRPTVLKLLNAAQNADGGFGQDETHASDLETTYRVMRCFHMLQSRPARPDDIEKWVASCRHAEGGYGVRPGQPAQVGATYFAAMILDWLASH